LTSCGASSSPILPRPPLTPSSSSAALADARPPALTEEAIRLSEILSALGHAVDLTEGRPEGHGVRCCWIGTAIGREVGLAEPQLWELYYALLLKDVGCSSNAARITGLFKTDDLAFKRAAKTMPPNLPGMLRFVAGHTATEAGIGERLRTLLAVVPQTPAVASEITATRCERGAEIALQLRFSDRVAEGVRCLDEHWDGGGLPLGVKGEAIPMYSRIALLAQVVDVFHSDFGRAAAIAEVKRRDGTWFDPALVAVFMEVQTQIGFWETLMTPHLERIVLTLEPARHAKPLDEGFLDDIAEAFADIVDSKSPYTSGHSSRVAELTDLIAAEMGVTPQRRRWLRRGALLHDIGKLGVSNMILDKPGPLTGDERSAMQLHALFTEKILSRIAAFRELARVAGAHHERLDGRGYPHGLAGDEIAMETRMMTTADIYDALTANRPYRAALTREVALEIMAGEVGTAIDPACFSALRAVLGQALAPASSV
jgi:HD-GYP domain-containing protein (c-di-GMP phosphodiesterase class II)